MNYAEALHEKYCAPIPSPSLDVWVKHGSLVLHQCLYKARRNSTEDNPASLHVPDNVIADLVECIHKSDLDRLKSFLHGPYRFVVNDWHINFATASTVSPSFPNISGRSILSLAAHACQNPDVVELILREGADIDFQDLRTGETPLMAAMRIGNCDVFELLLANGASNEVYNSDGLNAMHVLALFGDDYRMMDELVSSGDIANLDNPALEGSHKGATALELVSQRENKPGYRVATDKYLEEQSSLHHRERDYAGISYVTKLQRLQAERLGDHTGARAITLPPVLIDSMLEFFVEQQTQ